MRVPASPRKKRLLWVCLILAAAAAVYWYPSVDKRVRIYFAERALVARKAELALDWLNSIPDHRSDGQREFLMARACRRLGQMDLVREYLQRAFDRGFPVERLQREQWLAMAQSGQMREAEPYLRQLLQDPGDDAPEICEAYAAGYFRNRQIGKAMPLIDAWQADFPNDPLPFAIRGGQFREVENWPKAIAEYKKVLQLTPEDTRTRIQLAICLKAAHQLDEAEREFRQCLKAMPQDEELLAEWGDMLLSIGSTDDAAAVFERLLTVDPKNLAARSGIGGILLMDGRAEDAVAMLQPLAEERPFDKKVLYSYASALQAAGKTEQAAKFFEQVTQAEAQLRRKQELLEELESNPDQVESRYKIGIIAMNHESPVEGIRWLMSAIDLDPGYTPAYAALADYYEKSGNTEMAQRFRSLAESPPKPAGTP